MVVGLNIFWNYNKGSTQPKTLFFLILLSVSIVTDNNSTIRSIQWDFQRWLAYLDNTKLLQHDD